MVVHADEACLGNGREPPTPGGAGGLVEVVRADGTLERRDYWVSEPDTTNNRMALRSAILALELLSRKGRSLTIEFVSDSSYLVRGMNEWVRGWEARGWKRKEGDRLVDVANVELWQELVDAAEAHDVTWTWVRGHAGNPRNEWSNELATRAAKQQTESGGLVASGYEEFEDREREKRKKREKKKREERGERG